MGTNLVFTINDFEGPLDLLLHLIKQDNIDIYDISIVHITEQYLDYISKMQNMSLDIASEYLVMAAELIEMKSRLLLPGSEAEEIEEEFREEIINRLVDYKQYKELCSTFKDLAFKRGLMFDKNPSNLNDYVSNIEIKNDGSVDELYKAFEDVLARFQTLQPLETKVTYREYSVFERCLEIKKIIKLKKKVLFNDLFENYNKDFVIVTFLSILDLARNHEIVIQQDDNFRDIYLVGGNS